MVSLLCQGRRRVSRVGFLVLSVLLLMIASEAWAETKVATELTLMLAAERTSNAGIGFYNLSAGKFSLDSAGSAEVKGQLTVDLKVSNVVYVDVSKAWVKARLADLRLTVGKTRLSWGEGFMFNAGDVLFNGAGADLSAEDLRDNNAWLLAFYLPLGDFSFVEVVGLPPDFPLKEYQIFAQTGLGAPPTLPGFDASSGGGRFYTKLGGLKLEGGYLFDGRLTLNKPYLSLQGNLGADFHVSSSMAIPANNPWTAASSKSWQITAGLLYQIALSSAEVDPESTEAPSSGSLDFRLEASVRPYGEWAASPQVYVFDPFQSGVASTTYALAIFPQISWKSDTVFVYARGIWSPVDMSAIASLGLQWAPLQGFKILAGVSWQMGESGDSYGFDRARGWQVTLGTRVNF